MAREIAKRRITFFRDNAGFATPPGRLVCARRLAEAEEYADSLGWFISNDPDLDPDLGDHAYWCGCQHPHQHVVELITLRDLDGNPLASIGGVIDADARYLRVIRAELALQFGAEERGEA